MILGLGAGERLIDKVSGSDLTSFPEVVFIWVWIERRDGESDPTYVLTR